MKKISLLVLVMLLSVSFLFAACDTAGTDTVSSEVSSVGVSSEIEIESSETSEDSTLPEGAVKVLYSRYSEKPYFAMVGTCTEGAVVTAECNGETVSTNSYKGWFSLRLRCDSGTAEVILTQTVNGEVIDEPLTYTAHPSSPGADMWGVVTGSDFQFFFQKMLPDFLGQNIPNASELNALTERVSSRLTQLRSYNPDADIIYLIVPASMSVYPELVPESYGEPAEQNRLDLTIDAINAGGGIAINLRELFAEHKEDEMPLYYKMDSHWSDYGAYVAYEAMFEHISQKFPEAAPRSAEEFNWNPDYYQAGDIAYYLNMSQSRVKEYAYYRTFNFDVPTAVTAIPRYRSQTMLCYSDHVTTENIIRTNRSELPSCVVLRDSYSTQIYDILAERMDTTHYLGMWNLAWQNATIANEKPDYVIYIVAEWNLDSILYN